MSQKKVIVRRFSPGVLLGYLPASGIVSSGRVDLLDLGGTVHPLPLSEIRLISYVRDFNAGDTVNPERLLKKTFQSRPRTEGLWVRLTMRDGEVLEGLAPLDVSLADGLMADAGIYLVPPDIRGNTLRLFVPRLAMEALKIVSVVTSPSTKKKREAIVAEAAQTDLFSLHVSPDSRPQ